jgi:hypothetical protein
MLGSYHHLCHPGLTRLSLAHPVFSLCVCSVSYIMGSFKHTVSYHLSAKFKFLLPVISIVMSNCCGGLERKC